MPVFDLKSELQCCISGAMSVEPAPTSEPPWAEAALAVSPTAVMAIAPDSANENNRLTLKSLPFRRLHAR
jgi:hypothetical protein